MSYREQIDTFPIQRIFSITCITHNSLDSCIYKEAKIGLDTVGKLKGNLDSTIARISELRPKDMCKVCKIHGITCHALFIATLKLNIQSKQ